MLIKFTILINIHFIFRLNIYMVNINLFNIKNIYLQNFTKKKYFFQHIFIIDYNSF